MSENSSLAVCLTFDFDAISVYLGIVRCLHAPPLSRGEFVSRVGVPRLLRLARTLADQGHLLYPRPHDLLVP